MDTRIASLRILLVLLFIGLVGAACTAAPAASPDEKTEIASVVTGFGQKLGQVSLLSPTAADDIRSEYAGYVSPALLDQWAADPLQAPGRVTSSPWPDHIEITSIDKIAAEEYQVTGNIIEVTSVEVGTGGAAATIPVRITLHEDSQGHWLITDLKQG